MRVPHLLFALSLFSVSTPALAAPPADVFVVIDGGPAKAELAGAERVINKWNPQPTPVVLGDTLPKTLGQMVGLTKLDGVSLDKPLHAVVLNPIRYTPPVVLVVPVSDAAALNASVATSPALTAHIKGGYAVIGAANALTAIEPYAAGLSKSTVRSGVHVVAYVAPVWAAFGAQFAGLRQMASSLLAGQKDQSVSPETVATFFDTVTAGINDTDELHLDISTAGTQAIFALGIKAKVGTAIDRYFAAQLPASFSALSRLAQAPTPMILAGSVASTPESAALFRSFLINAKEPAAVSAFSEFQKLWTGELAFAGALLGPGKVALQSILGVSDSKRAAELVPATYQASDSMTASLMSTKRTDKPSYSYGGTSVSGQLVVQEPKKSSKGPGKLTNNVEWAGVDHSLLTVGDPSAAEATSRMHKLIDAAHGKGTLVLSAGAAASLARARAAKAALWSLFDLNALSAAGGGTNKSPLPNASVIATFGDHTGRLTFTVGE